MLTPRIAPLSPPYEKAVADRLTLMMGGDPDVEPLALFRSFARHMPFVEAMGSFGGYMLSRRSDKGASFDVRSRELVIDRVCALCGCEYEWGVHVTLFAKAAQLTEAQIVATVHGEYDAECWSVKDQAVLQMTDELHRTGRLSEEAFAKLSEHFDAAQMIDLMALAGWYHVIAYLANGMGTPLEEWGARFPKSV